MPLLAVTKVGLRLLIIGAGLGSSTVKLVLLVAVPPGVVTASRPLLALAGTMKERVVASTIVKLLTLVPFRVTLLAPVKLVPVIVTLAPTRPLAGVKLTSVGAGMRGAVIVNVAAPDVLPSAGEGLATVMLTVPVATSKLAGTWAVSWVAAS